jgi:hypothetical protein
MTVQCGTGHEAGQVRASIARGPDFSGVNPPEAVELTKKGRVPASTWLRLDCGIRRADRTRLASRKINRLRRKPISANSFKFDRSREYEIILYSAVIKINAIA